MQARYRWHPRRSDKGGQEFKVIFSNIVQGQLGHKKSVSVLEKDQRNSSLQIEVAFFPPWMESLTIDPQILETPGTAKTVPTETGKGLPSLATCGSRAACHGAYLKNVPSVCQLGLISSLAFLISRSVNQLGSCNIHPPRNLLSRLRGLVPACLWKVETVCV